MLTKLEFKHFKNFEQAELSLGPLSLLIGSNASGKSNIRDAFRFLHGLARGYRLAEIMGEKYIEGGVLQWRGIRGGTREITYQQAETFQLTAHFNLYSDRDLQRNPFRTTYSIEVQPLATNGKPRVIHESLYAEKFVYNYEEREFYSRNTLLFDSRPIPQTEDQLITIVIPPDLASAPPSFVRSQPVLTQLPEKISKYFLSEQGREFRRFVEKTIDLFGSMRFLDLNAGAMRLPSFPGQTVLGDQGENLSSVLQTICEEPQQKSNLIEWVKELTPMDAVDFEFTTDQIGRVLVNLIESNGQRTSAYSASDGTLRFLAMIAAVLGPEPARLYFLEELDNGLHPARLHLLLQLLEAKTTQDDIQIITTSHSPQLLRLLSAEAQEEASLIYRLPNSAAGHIQKILDIPNIRHIIQSQDLAHLHESGWFEDAMVFLDGETMKPTEKEAVR